MKQIHWSDAKEGMIVFDTKVGKFGTLIGFGQSGNYDIHYVDFGNGRRGFKPMLDAFEKRYLYYSAGGKNPDMERIVTDISEAIEFRDCYVSDREIRNFVKRNYSELKAWTFAQFVDFASDLEGSDCDWEETCRRYDLK